MKKMRFLSVMLCLALLASMLAAPALADDSTGSSAEGLSINKTAVYNAETNDYTITLEAYATGSKVTTSVNKDVPTDIVLVLDQSGSMKNDMQSTSYTYEAYTDTKNSNLYQYRHNNGWENLYYELEDGSYVSVSVERTAIKSFKKLDSLVNYKKIRFIFASRTSTECYYYYVENNIPLYEKVGEEYKTVEMEYNTAKSETFLYRFADGDVIQSTGNNTKPNFNGHDALYIEDETGDYNYRYVYTDGSGNVQEIGTSTGNSATFTEKTLYQRKSTTSSSTRLAALEAAVTTFVNVVAEKSGGADKNIATTNDNVDHRIAIVGFGSKSGNGNNTELLSIAGNNSGKVGVAYNWITEQNTKDVLQDMSTANGQQMVRNAIDALAAEGATRIDLGMKMAQSILTNNPVKSGETRNRVVIVFTDGSPTDNNGFEKKVAENAISESTSIKNTGVTVYTIGIFSGADATSAGAEPKNDLNQNSSSIASASNWFMQRLSSNTKYPQSPSYYLSAADASSLNSIFEQIAQNIESGGSSTTLGAETVIKDVIAPQFELPEGTTVANITLETYACTGKNGDEYTWTKNDTAMGATATVNGDKVDVTGFDFSKNWCGTETTNGNVTYHGNKLVISFKVKAKDAFLGGNDVFTNTNAGVYENDAATEPVATFDRPQVNVPIKAVTVTAEDKNVYLLGDLTAEQIKAGATVNCENVSLNLGADNYGLESWQNEYVNIEVTYTDASGNAVTDLSQLKADTTYTVTATVKPKTDGSQVGENGGAANPMDGKAGNATQHINVFKPELTVTFKDNTVDYMSAIDSTNYVSNGTKTDYTTSDKVSETEVWKHGETDSTDVTMIGEKPTLTKTYTYSVSEGVTDGKVTSITYVPVKAEVAVKIGETPITAETTFLHLCDVTFKEGSTCQWDDSAMKDGDPAFLLHVENVCADLTIKKVANDVAADPGQSFLFTITGPNNYTNEVIIVGNGSVTIKDLQIGEYTVTEDTSWSWRYTPDKESESITLDSDSDKNVVTFTNTRDENQWLDGNTSVDNVFGDSSITQTYNNPAAATN